MKPEMKRLKQRLKDGEVVLGTWNGIPSASLVNAIAISGLDFIIIDAEHGPVSMQAAEDLVRAAHACGTTALIRVPAIDAHCILRALDIGSDGVQVPHVSTKQEARRAVSCAKYYPIGKRGFSPFTRAGRYGQQGTEHARVSNENTMVVLNIEGAQGIKNIKEITSVKGADVIFIGPYDLSQSLGKPGKVDDPEVINAVRKSAKLIKNQGLVCGSFARDARYLDILVDCGVQYITWMVDCALITQVYKDMLNVFKNKIKRAK